eukprot:11999891-Heterocapsa_arctica.AAC.1
MQHLPQHVGFGEMAGGGRHPGHRPGRRASRPQFSPQSPGVRHGTHRRRVPMQGPLPARAGPTVQQALPLPAQDPRAGRECRRGSFAIPCRMGRLRRFPNPGDLRGAGRQTATHQRVAGLGNKKGQTVLVRHDLARTGGRTGPREEPPLHRGQAPQEPGPPGHPGRGLAVPQGLQ